MIADGIYDVIVHPTGMAGYEGGMRSAPPPAQDIQLTSELSVVRLPVSVANTIMDCCDPQVLCRGDRNTITRVFSQRYTMVRRVESSSEGTFAKWDEDGTLQKAVAISRLVYPTPLAFEYGAVITVKDAVLTNVDPANCGGPGRASWVAPGAARDWLTADELMQVARLLKHAPLESLPARAVRALWFLEYAFRTKELYVRWTLVCTGLEALIHVGRHRSTAQFIDRTMALATAVGITTWTREKAGDAYDSRSQLSHTGTVSTTGRENELYTEMEALLRATIRKAIEDTAFARLFASDDSIRSLA